MSRPDLARLAQRWPALTLVLASGRTARLGCQRPCHGCLVQTCPNPKACLDAWGPCRHVREGRKREGPRATMSHLACRAPARPFVPVACRMLIDHQATVPLAKAHSHSCTAQRSMVPQKQTGFSFSMCCLLIHFTKPNAFVFHTGAGIRQFLRWTEVPKSKCQVQNVVPVPPPRFFALTPVCFMKKGPSFIPRPLPPEHLVARPVPTR